MPWRASEPAELVVHHLDLLVDEHVGQVDRRVGDGVLDDPVGEGVAGAIQRVGLEPLPDVGAQVVEGREVAEAREEVLVEVRLDLLAQLLEVDGEVGRLSGQAGLAVVLGEGDVEGGRLADLEPDEIRLEPRDQALLAQDERHPIRGAALERLAVAGAHERDDRVVTVPGAAVVDGPEGRVLVAQLLDDLVDPGVVDHRRSRARS